MMSRGRICRGLHHFGLFLPVLTSRKSIIVWIDQFEYDIYGLQIISVDEIKMPWEKSFNEQEVLDSATQVFWQKGYNSTSIADLIERTGLNRGSLYNAYGGKQALFVKALQNYDHARHKMLATLEVLDEPKKAIVKFFDDLVMNTLADKERKGCFLFNTALEIYAHDQDVNEIVTRGINQIEAFFRRSIEVGQARGDIKDELNPEEAAKALIALTVAIRVLGRGVFDESALKMIANQAKKIIL